jgi:UPF0716 protein FxsA
VRPFALVGIATVVVVAVEVAVFVGVVKLIGLPWALAALVALCLVGGWLVPRQGIRAWRRFRVAAQAGTPPGRQVTDGLIGLIGALLLAVPGFVTAVVGVALLVPPLRWYARDRLERSVERRTSSAVAGNLFGPRRVRVRRGRTDGPTTGQPPMAEPEPPRSEPPPTIEGEIIDRP